MIGTVIKKEILENLLSFKFSIITILSAVGNETTAHLDKSSI